MPPDTQLDLVPDSRQFLEVITLWRPWSQWVMMGWKPIETRLHARFACLKGQQIGIHAALKWDKDAITAAKPYLNCQQYEQTLTWAARESGAGCILGTVWVEDVRWLKEEDSAKALIECRTPLFGLILRDPVQFHVPLPACGGRGIWKVDKTDLIKRKYLLS